jgi:uncharacterized protein
MSRQAVIDSLKFAREHERLAGGLEVARLERLREDLYDAAGSVDFTLSGALDDKGRPVLQLGIVADLRLRCQRCLGPVAFPLTASMTLVLATEERDFESAEVDGLEAIPASRHMRVPDLVEDELLLAMPMFARHADEACGERAATAGDPVATEPAGDDGDGGKPSPFAVLRTLKDRR